MIVQSKNRYVKAAKALMFTGLIETLAKVRSLTTGPGGTAVLTLELGPIAAESNIGDSIAINGVCLTVTKIQGPAATFDVSRETIQRSSLANIRPGAHVNVERALKASGRLAGHIVQGHIDATATVSTIEKRSNYADFKFAADPDLLQQMVKKGSVAVDGISLTVADLDEKTFTTAIIPETMKNTTLASAKTGDIVNIETDIIVKTVKRHLANILPAEGGLTADKLRQFGF